MRFEIPLEGGWEAANEACREALGVGPSLAVYAFRGLAGATWEIAQGLARAFPHRRTVAYWQGQGALFEGLAAQLSSDGCAARALESREMLEPEAWLAPTRKDLLMVLDAVDDPVSGEALAAPALDLALKDARAFRLRISHFAHRRALPPPPGPYEARICAIDPDLAVAICGARVKVDAPIARRMSWRGLDGTLSTESLFSAEAVRARARLVGESRAAADCLALAAFAKNLPAGAVAVPPSPLCAGPAFDRILFSFDDVDGLSVLRAAKEALGAEARWPGAESLVEAGSECRWAGPGALDRFLKARGLSARAGRGLLALAPELATAGARAALEAAREKILRIQAR